MQVHDLHFEIIYVEHCKYTTNLIKASGKGEIIIPPFENRNKDNDFNS